MRAYRVATVISQEGILALRAVPLCAGAMVEVLMPSRDEERPAARNYPSPGKVLHYDHPDTGQLRSFSAGVKRSKGVYLSSAHTVR